MPPMKDSVAPSSPSALPTLDLGGFPSVDDTPKPPMKEPVVPTSPAAPTALDLGGFPADDETPLPPLRPSAAPAEKKNTSKDPFAALFENSGGDGSFDNLNLDLEVVGGYPTDTDQTSTPKAQPGGSGQDAENMDGFFDLDKPLPQEENKQKDGNDPFGNLDDFDISKFKL